jgi:hypothetical protein
MASMSICSFSPRNACSMVRSRTSQCLEAEPAQGAGRYERVDDGLLRNLHPVLQAVEPLHSPDPAILVALDAFRCPFGIRPDRDPVSRPMIAGKAALDIGRPFITQRPVPGLEDEQVIGGPVVVERGRQPLRTDRPDIDGPIGAYAR